MPRAPANAVAATNRDFGFVPVAPPPRLSERQRSGNDQQEKRFHEGLLRDDFNLYFLVLC